LQFGTLSAEMLFSIGVDKSYNPLHNIFFISKLGCNHNPFNINVAAILNGTHRDYYQNIRVMIKRSPGLKPEQKLSSCQHDQLLLHKMEYC